MDSRGREVIRIGDSLFDKKKTVDALWQEIALNFYPERADFTTKRNDGEEYADHLFSSYPVLARRELGNTLSEFLRPDKFFSIHVDDEDLDQADTERAFLERMTDMQWRAMTDQDAGLVTAAGQTDHDFATFGNGVEWYGLNVAGNGLLFRNYHLRDNAWTENAEAKIDCNHRNWKPTARQLYHHFPKTISKDVKKACGLDGDNGKDPEKPFECRHVVLPARLYQHKSKGGKQFPFVSLYVERESETVLEEVGLAYFPYIISRWQQMSGSPFGTAMTTAVLLPDGRTLQVVMRTLREAGEMHVNPPMVGVTEFIRSDIALYPGGITTADAEYDSQIGDVLRPIQRDKSGFPIGSEIAEALKQDMRSGWFLDKIQLPPTTGGSKMTATEVRRQIQEQIRASAPLAKPIQLQRNHPMCDGVFQLLMANGVFPVDQMPESLAGRDIKFKFRSPLDDLAEQNEAATFIEVRDTIIGPTAAYDPAVAEIVDWETATREASRAAGFKAKWLKPKEAVEQKRAEMMQRQQAAQLTQELAAGAEIAEKGGKGLDAIVKATTAANGAANGQAAPPR